MSQVFQRLCAKTIDLNMMSDLKQEATITFFFWKNNFLHLFSTL
jgi:hypothetical protein